MATNGMNASLELAKRLSVEVLVLGGVLFFEES